jgi:hypothetical protein
MGDFDCFVGIDWSGNKRAWQKGLQIALASPGSSAPVLVSGPNGRWSRTEAWRWIGKLIQQRRALIGLDFAFGIPSVHEFVDGVSLNWEYVELLCARDDNLYGGRFFRDENSARTCLVLSPWLRGGQCRVRPLRKTEVAAKKTPGATPQSIFIAIGKAQVGLSSISGMRMLRLIKQEHSQHVSIWPFDEVDDARSVIVEIFPRYFPCSKGLSPNLSNHQLLNKALSAFGSATVKKSPASEDEGDALLSAAALRFLSKSGALFQISDPVARQEGWIFGVPFGGVQ